MLTSRATWVLSLWLAAGAHAAAQAPPPDAAAPHAGSPLPQVTVEADRATLQRRLYTFVATLAREIPRDEALRRWQVPICPLVAGLTHEQGEFILERLSQIATQVGAPLDKESCVRPNLVVVVSPKPEELLKAWDRHHRMFVGPRDSKAVFQRFRQQSRAVRVWYNHDFGSAKRAPILNGSLQIGKASWGIASGGDNSLGSKTFVRDVLAFSSVAVIVDGRQIVGLQIRQLSDYIALAALTEPDLDAPLGDAPTILRLFSARAAGQPLPAELSPWDQEFLKSLYDMTLESIMQRSQITDRMFRDLAP
jgi:hypothetical protein